MIVSTHYVAQEYDNFEFRDEIDVIQGAVLGWTDGSIFRVPSI